MENRSPQQKWASKSWTFSLFVAFFILVSNLLYSGLLCFLAVSGITLFWLHFTFSAVEVLATLLLLRGLYQGSIKDIRVWEATTSIISFANVTSSLLVKCFEDVHWNYVFIQVAIGGILLFSVAVVHRHANISHALLCKDSFTALRSFW